LNLPHASGQLSRTARSALPADVPKQDASGRYVCDDRLYAGTAQMRRITKSQYEHAIRDMFDGVLQPSAQFPSVGGSKSMTGFSTEPSLSLLGAQSVEEILYAAEDVALAVTDHLQTLLPCAQNNPNRDCAAAFVSTYGRRGFRRSLSADEQNALLTTFDAVRGDGGDFVEALAALTTQLLASPQFVLVVEGAGNEGRTLTGDELATRLGFALWDSIPDEALLAAAPSLTDRTTLTAEVTRMLDSPKANTAIVRFFREWTGAAKLPVGQKDPALFPYIDEAYATTFDATFDAFLIDAFRQGRTVSTLLGGANGLMTQPALLASLAHSAEPSYVYRGRFVRTRLLCNTLGSPPPNAMVEVSSLPPNPTSKEVSANVRARAACTGCHSLMDPAGLAFEGYDAMGQPRTTYRSGKSIDTSGSLPNVGGRDIVFNDPAELMQQLAEEPTVLTCFSKQVFRFVASRLEQETDACAIQAVGDVLTASNGSMPDALVAMLTSDAFTARRDE
jgi:hypothetical protein